MTMKEVQEIIDIALKVNGLGKRDQEFTADLPTVFIRYSGHVADITVYIHEAGWAPGAHHDREFEFDTNRPLGKQSFGHYKDYMAKLLERCPHPGISHE